MLQRDTSIPAPSPTNCEGQGGALAPLRVPLYRDGAHRWQFDHGMHNCIKRFETRDATAERQRRERRTRRDSVLEALLLAPPVMTIERE